jgi:hypothetical protein
MKFQILTKLQNHLLIRTLKEVLTDLERKVSGGLFEKISQETSRKDTCTHDGLSQILARKAEVEDPSGRFRRSRGWQQSRP